MKKFTNPSFHDLLWICAIALTSAISYAAGTIYHSTPVETNYSSLDAKP
jgi:hypothetical protein